MDKLHKILQHYYPKSYIPIKSGIMRLSSLFNICPVVYKKEWKLVLKPGKDLALMWITIFLNFFHLCVYFDWIVVNLGKNSVTKIPTWKPVMMIYFMGLTCIIFVGQIIVITRKYTLINLVKNSFEMENMVLKTGESTYYVRINFWDI